MATKNPSGQESVVEKRAKYEKFAMTVLSGDDSGRINVCNLSYGNEAGEHIYNVRVEGNETVECTCPADEYQPGPCKHRLAVEARPIVLSSASCASQTRVMADGGHPEGNCESPNSKDWCNGPEHADNPERDTCILCESYHKFGYPDSHDHVEESGRTEKADFGGGETTGVVDL